MTEDEKYDLIRAAALDATRIVVERLYEILSDETQPTDMRVQAAALICEMSDA